jgi:hypothetical protein
MKNFMLIVITLGLILYLVKKGEKANTGTDGNEIEPLTFFDKLLKGMDLTVDAIKETIQLTKKPDQSEPVNKVEYVDDLPPNGVMIEYSNPLLSFHGVSLKKRRGLFVKQDYYENGN